MIKLTPAYVPRLRREKVKKTGITDGTDNVNDAAFAIAGYIQFCEDLTIPKKTIKMFPNNKPWVTPELKHLLNQKKCLFKSGVVPSLWKQSMIVPVPKNNSPRELNDLRPVALTSTVMKCFEKIILKQLLSEEHLEHPKSLVKIVFIDFSSAFNTIQPHLMVRKLLHLGVNPRLILWIHDFLTDRKQQVKFNSHISSLKMINTGAPQGCVLSPILYTLYTNDCQASSLAHTYFKYADDTALVGFLHPDTSSVGGFEREVQGFINWCSDNFLQVNVKKTKEMLIDFSKKGILVSPSEINGEQIERVSSYKYLGIEIDDKLCFNHCAQTKCKKLQQRMLFLRKLNDFRLDSSILQLFYKSLLQSILSFGLICVFGNLRVQNQKKLQRIIKSASRVIGVDQASTIQLYNELILGKMEHILADPTHPLFPTFVRSTRSNGRILQRAIRTARYHK
ncbi:RNA-directed DNA polymerase from mobile element jockey [Merluccius polli]|uniref:RNA-directed DNA polymerase from mobile element jockey n=1 Tax=Merluccius polli TaxID=89951 RepID=A0AA47MU42_MERPO|nr:RNA-directed DNA polymerase from mobile element jockey [Merluccius polli]